MDPKHSFLSTKEFFSPLRSSTAGTKPKTDGCKQAKSSTSHVQPSKRIGSSLQLSSGKRKRVICQTSASRKQISDLRKDVTKSADTPRLKPAMAKSWLESRSRLFAQPDANETLTGQIEEFASSQSQLSLCKSPSRWSTAIETSQRAEKCIASSPQSTILEPSQSFENLAQTLHSSQNMTIEEVAAQFDSTDTSEGLMRVSQIEETADLECTRFDPCAELIQSPKLDDCTQARLVRPPIQQGTTPTSSAQNAHTAATAWYNFTSDSACAEPTRKKRLVADGHASRLTEVIRKQQAETTMLKQQLESAKNDGITLSIRKVVLEYGLVKVECADAAQNVQWVVLDRNWNEERNLAMLKCDRLMIVHSPYNLHMQKLASDEVKMILFPQLLEIKKQ